MAYQKKVVQAEKEEVVATPKVARTREKRVPFGVPRTKLGVSQEIEGYHLHWINDTVGRIMEAEKGGYEFVSPEEVGISSSDETRVKVRVGSNDDGTGMFAYLMKIRQEWYEEDQAEIQSLQDKHDEAIRGGKLENVANSYNAGIKYKS